MESCHKELSSKARSPDVSSLRIRSLKRKAFANLFWLLNTICNLQQLRIPLRDFLNLILVCNDNGTKLRKSLNGTRTRLRKSLKGILNCCKLKIVFKSQNKLAKAFRFKDRTPKELTTGVVYKFQCGLGNESYYGECVRHLNVRIGEHIGISPLTKKKVKPKGSAVSDHMYFVTILHPLKILVF